MKNFDEILAEVARQNGTTPENVVSVGSSQPHFVGSIEPIIVGSV